MHVGGHVAGVDRVAPQLGVLDAEDGGQLVERGLAGAVAAPALVGLDGRVGGDVDDPPARARERRQEGRGERERRDDVHGEDPLEVVGPQAGQRRQRAGAELAGVVDQQVEAPADGRGEGRPVGRVGDVAADGGDQCGPGQRGDGGGQPVAVPAVDDQPPAALVQGARQGPAEAPGGAGDDGERVSIAVSMGLPSDLKCT